MLHLTHTGKALPFARVGGIGILDGAVCARHCTLTQGFLGSPLREGSKFLVSFSPVQMMFLCAKVWGSRERIQGPLLPDTVVRTVLAFIAAEDEDCANVLLWVGLWGS